MMHNHLCLQYTCFMILQFLPVYVPSEAEKNDAMLFARNVRAKMAEYVCLVCL
jgi:hypothetical protein